MRILITGGFGFVGGRLARHLQQAGHQIILGSRNARSSPDWLPQAKVVQTDWNDGRALEEICNGVDMLIQAAGMNALDCVVDPVAALEFNGLATARLVGMASRAGVKRFIYLSTAHVYASPLVGAINEEFCPRNLHPYATSHLAAENAVLSASQRGEVEGIVLRLSNAFGAPVHQGVNCWMLLVNDLCRQAVETRKLVLHSDGLQQRDFIAMTEVCRVVECLSSRDFDVLLPGVFNVGSGVSLSVLEMAQLIQQRCKLVLDFEPELQRPEASIIGKHEMLKFRADRLTKIGVNVHVDNNSEIDRLLAFCQASYNQDWSERI
jgi:UDP-glucose 4-epimerase